MIKLFITFSIFVFQLQTLSAHVYKIKPGKHYAQGFHTALFFNNNLSYEAKFDESVKHYVFNDIMAARRFCLIGKRVTSKCDEIINYLDVALSITW